jgi:hypothetical protein
MAFTVTPNDRISRDANRTARHIVHLQEPTRQPLRPSRRGGLPPHTCKMSPACTR